MALGLEHHSEGSAVSILIVSDVPGVLGWDPALGLSATDDTGFVYRVRELVQTGGLGSLSTTAWLDPAVSTEARVLSLSVDEITRTSAQHGGGGGAERLISGGPWELEVPLRPARTVTEAPPAPGQSAAWPARPSRVPGRTPSTFRRLVPVGQARIRDGYTVCLHALEAYEDRSILTLSILADAPLRARPLDPAEADAIEAWDDQGNRYQAALLGGPAALGWSDAAIELAPALDPTATRLAIRLPRLPLAGEAGRHQVDAITFAVAITGG